MASGNWPTCSTRGPLPSSWRQNTRSHNVSYPMPNFDQTAWRREGSSLWLKHTWRAHRKTATAGCRESCNTVSWNTHTHTHCRAVFTSLTPSLQASIESTLIKSNQTHWGVSFGVEQQSRLCALTEDEWIQVCTCASTCPCMCALQPICTVAVCMALPVCVGLGVLHVCVHCNTASQTDWVYETLPQLH